MKTVKLNRWNITSDGDIYLVLNGIGVEKESYFSVTMDEVEYSNINKLLYDELDCYTKDLTFDVMDNDTYRDLYYCVKDANDIVDFINMSKSQIENKTIKNEDGTEISIMRKFDSRKKNNI